MIKNWKESSVFSKIATVLIGVCFIVNLINDIITLNYRHYISYFVLYKYFMIVLMLFGFLLKKQSLISTSIAGMLVENIYLFFFYDSGSGYSFFQDVLYYDISSYLYINFYVYSLNYLLFLIVYIILLLSIFLSVKKESNVANKVSQWSCLVVLAFSNAFSFVAVFLLESNAVFHNWHDSIFTFINAVELFIWSIALVFIALSLFTNKIPAKIKSQKNARKQNIVSKICIYIFSICIIINIVFDYNYISAIRWYLSTSSASAHLLEINTMKLRFCVSIVYFVIYALFIVFLAKKQKTLNIIPVIMIGIGSIICNLGVSSAIIVVYSVAMAINIALSKKNKPNIAVGIYSYFVVAIGFILSLCVFPFRLSLIENGEYIASHPASIIDLFYTIVFFIGMTVLSLLYCNKINISIDDKAHGAEVSANNAKMIKGYLDLLEKGIITQEEYEKKKNELLNK